MTQCRMSRRSPLAAAGGVLAGRGWQGGPRRSPARPGAPFRDSLARLEMTPLVMEPSRFRERMLRQRDAWGAIVAASGFRPDE